MPFALACSGIFDSLCADPRRPRGARAGLWAACAALLRADGGLWAGLVLFVASWSSLEAGTRALRRALLVAGAMLLVTIALNVAWRHAYYGE